MKRSDLSKVVGAGLLSLSVTLVPLTLPASAQNTNDSGTTNAARDTGIDNTRHDGGFDWGWLGLIGLAGLAGLSRKREEPVAYRDPNSASRTNYTE